MPLKLTCHIRSIVLMLFLLLPTVVTAEVVCQNRNPAVPITTPTSDFVLHNDGTVTHTPTGLMWMRCSLGQTWDGASCSGEASTYTWADALQAAAQNTRFAGYADWRLPNRRELLSIVEQSCWAPSINAAVFPSTPSQFFWSSSPNADSSGPAWGVHFVNGHVDNRYKYNANRVRLVRAPQPTVDDDLIAGRYLPIEDGSIIRDITTDLEWQRCSVGQTWNATRQSCEGRASNFNWDNAVALTAPGGFRLPDITELRSLVYCSTGLPHEFGTDADFSRCSGDYQVPTIVEQAFPNTPVSWFWSSSPSADDSNFAWNVGFSSGRVSNGGKSNTDRVRLVRAPQ